MTIIDIIYQVIEWALYAPHQAPPVGQLFGVNLMKQNTRFGFFDKLLNRPVSQGNEWDAVDALLQTLIRITAARERFILPFLDDDRPVSRDIYLLALAISIANEQADIAKYVISCFGRNYQRLTANDVIARHGLIYPAQQSQALPRDFREQLSVLSPYTLLITTPGQYRAQLLSYLNQLEKNAQARRNIILELSKPTDDRHIRDWRSTILYSHYTRDDYVFVLDTYETQMVYHQKETLNQIGRANQIIRARPGIYDDESLEDAMSVALWWKSLRYVERNYPDELRNRHGLDVSYSRGLDLFRDVNRLTGGKL